MNFREMVESKILESTEKTPEIESMTFYHGTSNPDAGKSIIKQGLKAPDLTGKKGFLTPVKGAVYATPHVDYAQIYAIGGDMAGHKWDQEREEKNGRHGYVFKFSGSKLSNIQPDEDSVGEMLYKGHVPWLNHLAKYHLADSTVKKVKEGEYIHWARAGKVLVKRMTPEQKVSLIVHHGAHVANFGDIEPDEAWKIDKRKRHLLKRDGSNFFDHAVKVHPKEAPTDFRKDIEGTQ